MNAKEFLITDDAASHNFDLRSLRHNLLSTRKKKLINKQGVGVLLQSFHFEKKEVQKLISREGRRDPAAWKFVGILSTKENLKCAIWG